MMTFDVWYQETVHFKVIGSGSELVDELLSSSVLEDNLWTAAFSYSEPHFDPWSSCSWMHDCDYFPDNIAKDYWYVATFCIARVTLPHCTDSPSGCMAVWCKYFEPYKRTTEFPTWPNSIKNCDTVSYWRFAMPLAICEIACGEA